MLLKNSSGLESEFPEIRKDILLEIELNGKIRFDLILNEIYHKLGIMYKIISADVEFFGDQNFGNIQLLIHISQRQHQQLRYFFEEKRLLSTSLENVTKKAV